MTSAPGFADALAPVRARAGRAALLFDFDGTLSRVVDDPAAAVPLPGVVERLDRLAAAYRRVGVLSGRPVAFLARHLPATVTLSGLYGLESAHDGARHEHPDAERWRPVVAEVAGRAHADPALAGAVIEPKDLSLTIHVRTRPDLEPAVWAWCRAEATATGLEARAAKRSVELHPPLPVDKGTALRALAEGCDAVVFVGDDRGDLPAFAALSALQGERPEVVALAIAVGSDELDPEVRAAADLLLPSTDAVVGLLDALLDDPDRSGTQRS